jgi:hypothetical protein
MSKFTIYPGKFICRTCKEEVAECRLYSETGVWSWMCLKKHLTKSNLYYVGYRKKKDYERKERK